MAVTDHVQAWIVGEHDIPVEVSQHFGDSELYALGSGNVLVFNEDLAFEVYESEAEFLYVFEWQEDE